VSWLRRLSRLRWSRKCLRLRVLRFMNLLKRRGRKRSASFLKVIENRRRLVMERNCLETRERELKFFSSLLLRNLKTHRNAFGSLKMWKMEFLGACTGRTVVLVGHTVVCVNNEPHTRSVPTGITVVCAWQHRIFDFSVFAISQNSDRRSLFNFVFSYAFQSLKPIIFYRKNHVFISQNNLLQFLQNHLFLKNT